MYLSSTDSEAVCFNHLLDSELPEYSRPRISFPLRAECTRSPALLFDRPGGTSAGYGSRSQEEGEEAAVFRQLDGQGWGVELEM